MRSRRTRRRMKRREKKRKLNPKTMLRASVGKPGGEGNGPTLEAEGERGETKKRSEDAASAEMAALSATVNVSGKEARRAPRIAPTLHAENATSQTNNTCKKC